MSQFLKKVEAKTNRIVHKPTKPQKAMPFNQSKATKKPSKPTKPNKSQKPEKFEKTSKTKQKYLKRVQEQVSLAKQNTKQTNFMRLRQIIPQFESMLTLANPFDLSDGATWGKFFAKAAPQVMVALLWDLGHIKPSDRAGLIRFFKQRVKQV